MPNVCGAVDPEILLIDGEHAMDALAFCDPHDRGIGKVHRQVVIFGHQLPYPRNVLAIERRDFESIDWR